METILIVDDQREVRLLLRLIFEDEGYKCLEASDGEIAIKMLTDHQPVDLLVTDFQMPLMNGLQLLNQLKTHLLWRNIPKIFITGEPSSHLWSEAIQAGANMVFLKPLDVITLIAHVQSLIRPLQTV